MAENVLYSVRSLLGKEFLCPNLSFIPKTNVSLQPCSLPVCRSSALNRCEESPGNTEHYTS